MIRAIWQRRDLVLSLIRRQYQLRYRQSLAGVAWAFVPPLATLGAATVVFGRVAKVDTGGPPYALFAFAALAPWTFFANSITMAVPSIVENKMAVTRLAFPRAALPLSMIGATVVDLAVASVMFVIFAYVAGPGLPLTALWFPLLLVIEISLVVGIVLLGSALNVFARDIRLAIPLVTQVWLLLTPVLYPLDSVPEGLRAWYLLNPMTGLIESFRDILLFGRAPDAWLLLPASIGAAVLLLVGGWYFAATESRFADAS